LTCGTDELALAPALHHMEAAFAENTHPQSHREATPVSSTEQFEANDEDREPMEMIE